MSKQIDVKALSLAIATVIVAAMGGSATDTTPATPEADKKSRGRPAGSTKAKKEEAEDDGLGDDDGLGLDGDDDGLGLDEAEEEITQEELVAAFKALKATKGLDACKKVLAELDESNALNIPAKKYPEAMKLIKRAGSKK